MDKLSRFVLRRPRLVALLTVLLLLIGAGATLLLVPRVSEENAYPGLPGYEANQRILEDYGTGGYERPFVPVITLPAGHSMHQPSDQDAVARAFRAASDRVDARTVSYADTADPVFVGENHRTTYGLVFSGPVEQGGIPGSALGETPPLGDAITAAMTPELPPGSTVRVTGLDALATGADTGGLNVPVKLLVTICAAIVVLVWVFRSALALVPLLVALVAIPASFAGLLALSAITTIHETTLMMIPLFGVGIAVDYALLLVTRWREERAGGNGGDEAIHTAMRTAGRAIVTSTVVVALGLATMLVLPIPLLRSLGLGGTTVALCSAVTSLTVLPLLLRRVGRRLDSRAARTSVRTPAPAPTPAPTRPDAGPDARPASRPDQVSRGWDAWARLVVRFRVPITVATFALLAGIGAIGLGTNLSVPTSDNLRSSGPAYQGLTELERVGAPGGALTAFDVYLPEESAAGSVVRRISDVPGVASVIAPADPDWRQHGSALVTVIPRDEGGSRAGADTIRQVIAAVGTDAMVGGNVTQQLDYVRVTYSAFPWSLALVAVVTFVFLTRAFRSVLLAFKAIVMNLLSLGAVLGGMVVLWQWGWGTEALLGLQPDGAIGTFVPVTIFAFLYGLTMDYEVFLLARMREEYDRCGVTSTAVIRGLGRTGRLVTAAALILFFSFASMTLGGELDVAIFASGVALGILIDATLIRCLLVPALVSWMGAWNWWVPAWLARLLRVSRESPEPAPETIRT